MKKKESGKCHICGDYAKLTYEHIPPAAAFNSNKAFIYFIKDVLGEDNFPWDLSGRKAKQLQKGIGSYTLCPRCNNNTGAWYGNAYVDFAHKGYSQTYGKKLGPNDFITITFQDIYPLKVIKQIAAMFFSINHEDFSTVNQELRAFILSKEKRGVPLDEYRFYLYLLRGSIFRHAGISGIGSFPSGEVRILSELSAPPFGYVLEINPKGKGAYCDVTFFGSDFDFDEQRTIRLSVPVYESNTYFPADYRTRSQVLQDYIRNKLIEFQRRKS